MTKEKLSTNHEDSVQKRTGRGKEILMIATAALAGGAMNYINEGKNHTIESVVSPDTAAKKNYDEAVARGEIKVPVVDLGDRVAERVSKKHGVQVQYNNPSKQK